MPDTLTYSRRIPTFRINFGSSVQQKQRESIILAIFWGFTGILCLIYVSCRKTNNYSIVWYLLVTALFRVVTQKCRALPNRWDETVDFYLTHIQNIGSTWKAAIRRTSYGSTGILLFNIAAWFLTICAHLGLISSSREIISIAKRAKVFVGDLLVMQYVYEACACCTSIVYIPNRIHKNIEAPIGCVHLRTLDWEMPFDLRPVTFNIDGYYGERHIFSATSWPAYAGILTGQKMGSSKTQESWQLAQNKKRFLDDKNHTGFAISTNFRLARQSYKHNFIAFVAGGWTIGQLIRKSLVTDHNYKQAVERLEHSWLIAPAYITISSSNVNISVNKTDLKGGSMTKRSIAVQLTRGRLCSLNPLNLCVDAKLEKDVFGGASITSFYPGSFKSPVCNREQVIKNIDDETTWKYGQDGKMVIESSKIRRRMPFLIQANVDHWHRFPDFMNSISRIDVAWNFIVNEKLKKTTLQDLKQTSIHKYRKQGSADITKVLQFARKMVSNKRILNSKTIYACIMIPSKNIYQSYVTSTERSSSDDLANCAKYNKFGDTKSLQYVNALQKLTL